MPSETRSRRIDNWVNCLPVDQIKFLTLEEILLIHSAMIRVFGGPDGIRDYGLIESALYRPRTGYYKDLVEMGAALFESILMNHPFIDGNKRVAFFSTDIFLRINGYKISVAPEEAHRRIIEMLETGTANKEQLEKFLRQSVVKLTGRQARW